MYPDRLIAVPGRAALVLIAALVSACGGGGGGGSSAAPADLAIIDAGNAESIVREVLSAGFDSSEVAGGGEILAADGGSSALVVHMAGRRTIQAAGQAVSGQVQPSASYGPDREDCLVSGAITFSASLASLDTLTHGDQITTVYEACDDGDGAVYNGRLRIDVQSFTGDLFADLYRLDGRFTFTNLAITEDGTTETSNGTLNVDMNLLTPDLESDSITFTRFTLRSGNTAWTFHDVVSNVEDDHRGDAWLTTLSESGSLESSNFEGRIDYGTLTPFQSVDGDYPATGVLRIDGANGASVVVTALDEENLQLAIDWNGDAAIDETRLMDWSTVPGW
jgi:hypothetical protein